MSCDAVLDAGGDVGCDAVLDAGGDVSCDAVLDVWRGWRVG